MSKFSAGSSSPYVELPVPAASLKWSRGQANLSSISKTDPAAFFGGWRAFVQDHEGNDNPVIPLPIVERVSSDGKHPYKVYANNYVNVVPIAHRTRFDLKVDATNPQTGQKYKKTIQVSKSRQSGFEPYKQIFVLLFSKDLKEFAPAVLNLYNWSSFISFEKADQIWEKIAKNEPEGKVLVRRYGTLGITENKVRVPKFDVFGQSRSTPIEAVGADKPVFIDITPEMNKLYEDSRDWEKCERWNATGEIAEEPIVSALQREFEDRCTSMGLSNIDMDLLLKENGGDYEKANAALTGDSINQEIGNTPDDINAQLEEAEEEEFDF